MHLNAKYKTDITYITLEDNKRLYYITIRAMEWIQNITKLL